MSQNEIEIIKSYVEGNINFGDFLLELNRNDVLRDLLLDKNRNWSNTYIKTNPLEYIQNMDENSLSNKLNLQGVLELVLELNKIGYEASQEYSDKFDLILDSQPRYINTDIGFIEKYITPKESSMTKKEIKTYMRMKFKEYFQFDKKPPKWIQNPEWPIIDDKPLFFVGQFEIKDSNIYHDNGSIYLFIDLDTEKITTITQLY